MEDKILKPRTYYTSDLKAHLPAKAFAPSKQKIFLITLYSCLTISGYLLFRYVSTWYAYVFLAIIQGHTLACLAFLAHDLSHGSIIENRHIRYILELWQWGLNLVPPTLWNRVHNQAHHSNSQTLLDPDRNYLIKEKTKSNSFYSKIFYPQQTGIKWNPLIGLHFIPYIFRNIVSAFSSEKRKLSILPHRVSMTKAQKSRITLELIVVGVLQVLIYYVVGQSAVKYLFASIVAICVTSSIVMIYVFTNHWLNPITDISDPLVGTTSVKVPTIFDKLHSNFSFHTEHHLFPNLNSDYYPAVSSLLKEKYSVEYNSIPITIAWRKLLGIR